MLQLRPFQAEALSLLESPGHLICVAATGSGKSLIYERFSTKPGTRTLLVTPLTALARQQHRNLQAAGVKTVLGAGSFAAFSRTALPDAEAEAWIVSPEMLAAPTRREFLKKWKPNFLVVDECHCLWEWGEDFRPAFRLLPELLTEVRIRRSLWLTATLPADAREDLRGSLPAPIRELGRFSLPVNLSLHVKRVPWPDRTEALLRWVNERKDSGIIFVGTREATLKLTRLLRALGKKVVPYHAGMSQEERRALETMIAARVPHIIVATSAFGMGMDYRHLKWVLLWQAPGSLLALAQAVGRVGRASSRGDALVFWDDDDFRLLEWMIRGSDKRKREVLQTRRFLSTWSCRRRLLSEYFDPSPDTASGSSSAACEETDRAAPRLEKISPGSCSCDHCCVE